MYIDYGVQKMVATSYEVWCTEPVQLIDRFDTKEEADSEMKRFLEIGTLYDEYLGRKYEAKNFTIICPGEDLEDYVFIREEQNKIRGRL